MLQSTVDSIIVIDHQGVVVAANHATENMFGYMLLLICDEILIMFRVNSLWSDFV